jgi:hypothetical protein
VKCEPAWKQNAVEAKHLPLYRAKVPPRVHTILVLMAAVVAVAVAVVAAAVTAATNTAAAAAAAMTTGGHAAT